MTEEEDNLTRAMVPTVYFLVIFSIVVHGLSIPALDAFYRWKKIPPISDSNPTEIPVRREKEALPSNAYYNSKRGSIIVNNRFSRPPPQDELPQWANRRKSSYSYPNRPEFKQQMDGLRYDEGDKF